MGYARWFWVWRVSMAEVDGDHLRSIVERLRKLSAEMIDLGAEMDYFGGFGEIAGHGRDLVGAGHCAQSWADGIERDCLSDGRQPVDESQS
jgi:hypothetical protein